MNENIFEVEKENEIVVFDVKYVLEGVDKEFENERKEDENNGIRD
nr:hypothetical protein [Staphylococcus epidermidis]